MQSDYIVLLRKKHIYIYIDIINVYHRKAYEPHISCLVNKYFLQSQQLCVNHTYIQKDFICQILK